MLFFTTLLSLLMLQANFSHSQVTLGGFPTNGALVNIEYGKSLKNYTWNYQNYPSITITGYFDPVRDIPTILSRLDTFTVDVSNCIPINKHFIIPDSVFYGKSVGWFYFPKTGIDSITIGASAFENSGLVFVKNTEKITNIKYCAFKDCNWLELPLDFDIVWNIEPGAFAGVKKVYSTTKGGYLNFYATDDSMVVCRAYTHELVYCSPYYTGSDPKDGTYVDSIWTIGLFRIEAYALYKCKQFKQIVIGVSSQRIGTTEADEYRYNKKYSLQQFETHWDSCTAKFKYSYPNYIEFYTDWKGTKFKYYNGSYGELYVDVDYGNGHAIQTHLIYCPNNLKGTVKFKAVGQYSNFFNNVNLSLIDSLIIPTANKVKQVKGITVIGTTELKNMTSLKAIWVNNLYNPNTDTYNDLPQISNCPNLKSIHLYPIRDTFSVNYNRDVEMLVQEYQADPKFSPINTLTLKERSNITLYVWDTIQTEYIKINNFNVFKAVVPVYPKYYISSKSNIIIKNKNNLLVYPNIIISNIITIKTSIPSNVICYNSLGKIVEITKIIEEKTIDVSNWSKGIYYIATQDAIQKIIIE